MSPTPLALYEREYRKAWIRRARRRNVDWTCVEQRRALDMRSRGKSYAQIALVVGRTPDAVAARLRYIRERGQ